MAHLKNIKTSVQQNGIKQSKTLRNYTYNRADRQYSQSQLGNGLIETRHYDTQGRLSQQRTTKGPTIINQYHNQYDLNSNLIKQQQNSHSEQYHYDTQNRLTQQQSHNLNQTKTNYRYDPNHNRTQKSSTQNTNTNNNTTSYHYQHQSNLLKNQESLYQNQPLQEDNRIEKSQYNAANRLSRYTITDDNNTQKSDTSYHYNALGQRTRKTNHHLDGTNTAIIYHYNLTGQLISETTAQGISIKDYIYQHQTPIAQINSDAQNNNDTLYYLHTDQLNTPRYATNEKKQIIWRWQGEAFGASKAEQDVDGDGQQVVINLRFVGQYYDDESGLHYNYFRTYDPSLGRYITSDPIGLLGGLNTYTYVGNNPLIYIDPYGLLGLDTITKKGLDWLTKKSAKDRNKSIKDEIIEDHFQDQYQKDIESGKSKEEAQKRLDDRRRRKDYEDNKDLGSKIWDSPNKIREILERIKDHNRITNPDDC